MSVRSRRSKTSCVDNRQQSSPGRRTGICADRHIAYRIALLNYGRTDRRRYTGREPRCLRGRHRSRSPVLRHPRCGCVRCIEHSSSRRCRYATWLATRSTRWRPHWATGETFSGSPTTTLPSLACQLGPAKCFADDVALGIVQAGIRCFQAPCIAVVGCFAGVDLYTLAERFDGRRLRGLTLRMGQRGRGHKHKKSAYQCFLHGILHLSICICSGNHRLSYRRDMKDCAAWVYLPSACVRLHAWPYSNRHSFRLTHW